MASNVYFALMLHKFWIVCVWYVKEEKAWSAIMSREPLEALDAARTNSTTTTVAWITRTTMRRPRRPLASPAKTSTSRSSATTWTLLAVKCTNGLDSTTFQDISSYSNPVLIRRPTINVHFKLFYKFSLGLEGSKKLRQPCEILSILDKHAKSERENVRESAKDCRKLLIILPVSFNLNHNIEENLSNRLGLVIGSLQGAMLSSVAGYWAIMHKYCKLWRDVQ